MAITGIVLCKLAVGHMAFYPLILLIEPDIMVLGMIGGYWVFGGCCVVTCLMFTIGLILAIVGFSNEKKSDYKEL
jgi:hypothetical protein